MQNAPIPPDEDERLAEVKALRILDTPPEERFDRLVALAARLFETPIAFIALVDSDRQWFKAKCGLTADETGRDISFCGHAIAGDGPLIVPDAEVDDRFADNPLVLGDPHVRFYVGCPLRGPGGHKVGTFCIADTRPRCIDDHDVETLEKLTDLAERELTLLDAVQTQQRLIQAQKLALATQERLRDELDQAARYVRSLLPAVLTDGPVRTRYELLASSALGGDMFGYHWTGPAGDGRLALYMLDVSGHGVGASLLAVSAFNTLHRQTLPDVDFTDPAGVLAGLNAAYPMEETHGQFITAWYGVYDVPARTLRHASAGHPPVIVTGLPRRRRAQPIGRPGLILGVEDHAAYANQEHPMPPGARLWAYSDGAFEGRSPAGADLGIAGLAEIIADVGDAEDGVAQVVRGIRQFGGREDFEDDVSLLAATFA